jgi:hypothetical protein
MSEIESAISIFLNKVHFPSKAFEKRNSPGRELQDKALARRAEFFTNSPSRTLFRA